jgi:LCP family protein required for cell wall assembly
MKKIVILFPAFILLLSILACTLWGPKSPDDPPVVAQTITPTRTGIPEATPRPNATEMATATPTTKPTVTPQALPPGRVLILVLGSDFRPRKGYRTDVVMLLTVDTRERTVSAISFPRDLYVAIPGWEHNRINTAMQRGGFDLLSQTFESNFGLQPDFYAMANMQAFSEIVERLDGVTVEVGQPLRDKCDRSLDLADDEGYCEVDSGPMDMNGATALWYVRSRYSTSDFDRLRRAQEVLLAIFSKMMSLDAIVHWPDVYLEYEEHVQTNIEIGDIVPLLPAVVEIYRDPSKISRYAVTRAEVTPFSTANGASVLLPDYEKIAEIIDQAVFAP